MSTNGKFRVEPDGTHVYKDYHRYKPVPLEDRKYAVRRPDDPRAVRFHGQWFLPLDVLPDERRCMPLTAPDSETLTHRARCTCEVCRRPAAAALWARKARQLEPVTRAGFVPGPARR